MNIDELLKSAIDEEKKLGTNTHTSLGDEDSVATQVLDDINSGKTTTIGANAPALREANFAQRVSAAGMVGGDRSSAYLQSKGLQGDKLSWIDAIKQGNIGELGTDVAESTLPLVTKLGAQVGGEVLGVKGGIPGTIAGGTAGMGAAQVGWEQAGELAGIGGTPEEQANRVRSAAIAGGVTSAGGLLLRGGYNLAKKIPLVKKGEEYLLTNITKMAPLMQQWVKDRWTDVYNVVKKPAEVLAKTVREEVVPFIGKLKANLGMDVTTAKVVKGLKPDLTGITDEVTNLVAGYGNITRGEKAGIIKVFRSLENNRTPLKYNEAGEVIGGGKKIPISAEKIMDRVTVMARQLTKAYDKLNPNDLQSLNAMQSLVAKTREILVDRLKVMKPDLGDALEQYKKFMNVHELFETYVGSDEKAIFEYMKKHLFNIDDIFGQDALTKMFDANYLGQGMLTKLRDLSAANFMRSGEVLTAGVKTFMPSAGGALLGGTVGAVADSENRLRGAAIGAGIGGYAGKAITWPYMTPAWASGLYRGLEKISPVAKGIEDVATKVAPYVVKLLTSPMASSINDMQDQFGLKVTEDDVKKLK